MTHQCEICQYSQRVKTPDEKEEQNACFVSINWSHLYQPFPKSNETVLITCTNFSHIQTGTFTLRNGKKLVVGATKEEPNVMLACQKLIEWSRP